MKKNFKINIIILVLIAFLVMYLSLKDDFNTVMNYILKINIFWFLIGILFMLLNIVFQSLSLYGFIRKIKSDYKFIDAFRVTACGQFFNAITPFSSGGQPFQAYMLKKQGIRISNSTNILLQNFITYQISLILIGTFSIFMNFKFHIFPNYNMLKNIVFLGYLINVIVLVAIVLLAYAKKFNTNLFDKIINFIFKFKFIKNKEEKKEKLHETLDNFYEGSVLLKNNKLIFFKSLIFNLFSLVCLYLVPLFIFYSMNSNSLSIVNSIVSSGYTYLIGSFVPIPGGTGGLEYAFTEFFKKYGSASFISSIMLLWRFITYYFGMILGGIILMIYKKDDE